MAAPTDEARELSLLNNVELRIALADTESKLQVLLKTYLTPILLKLASPHAAVRNKVIAICQHVNTRIKSQPIQLPVEALLKQFKDPEVGGKHALIRNFDLMYIQQGVGRIDTKDRLALLPVIVSGISATPQQHQSQIFNILLEILPYYVPPPRGTTEDIALLKYFSFDTSPEDADFLHNWFTKLMLLNFQTVASSGQQTCRGLTPAEYSFLTFGGKKETWNPPGRIAGEKLKDAKIAVLKFISTGAWTDEQRYLPTLLASANSINENSKVVELAEEIFKRSAPGVPLDGGGDDGVGEKLIDSLYQYLFFGEEEENGVARGIPPVRWTLRQRIITILAKSKRSVSGEKFGRKVPLVLDLILGRSIADTIVDWADPGDKRKLKRETFLYANWFSRMTDELIIERYGPGIVEKMRYFIAEENNRILERGGSASRGFKGAEDLRGLAFETMGLICRRLFKTLVYEPELAVLRFMFSTLRDQSTTAGVRQSVEEALSSLLVGFSSSGVEHNENVEDAMAELLVEEVEDEIRVHGYGQVRKGGLTYVAARFANRGLGFANVKGKWICLLAIGASSGSTGGRDELVEEAHRGLDPYWYKMLNPKSQIVADENKMIVDMKVKKDRYSLPDFGELIEYITSSHPRLSGAHGNTNILHNIPPAIYANAVDYCRKILMMQAISSSPEHMEEFTSDSHSFTTKLNNAFTTDAVIREKVAELISSYVHSSSPQQSALANFFAIAIDGMLLDIPNCAEAWVDLCELAPQDFVANWAGQPEKVDSLLKMVLDEAFSTTGADGNRDLEKRNLLAKALGSVLTHSACDANLHDVMERLMSMSKEGGYKTYTAIIAIGYILGRLALRNRLEDTLDKESISKNVYLILKCLGSTDRIVIEAGLQALCEISVFGVLTEEHLQTAEGFLDKLKMLATQLNMERAITGLGCFSLLYSSDKEEDQNVLDGIEETLYALHENKQLELSFAVGEALSVLAAGWSSKPLARRYLDIRGASPPAQVVEKRKDAKLLKKVLSKILDKFSKSTKPSLRRGVCVWLLSLVEGCGDMEEVSSRLKDAQAAFRGFLVDREEFVQETASRGLTLVYEKGDKEMKDELVRSLIASFTGDTKAQTLAGQVTADTQLFEPGVLQTGTSDHGSISTYRDIMSLASEVGDPSLIYRFMSLARHNSLWASRASFGRYGLGTILSSSSTSVDGYLTENPKLYPKLYRYRFDPNPNVRKSMNDIWSALVKDSQSILNTYFDNILQDLLKSILDREWRVREASCAALADLIQGKEISRYASYLEKIWGVAFKVMDDIKESVRVAALALCRVLASIMVRIVDVDSGASQKDADMVLENLMPFLLGIQGLEAQAKEVQYFALDTLMKLIKNAGKTLRRYIPELIEKLLGLLSTLEHQALNYLHLNASKYNLTEEKIDAARLSGVRGSPIMDAIERCLDLVDDAIMARLAPRLTYTTRKAVGMPSKVGCSRVMVTLVVRHSFLTKPHADELLKAVMGVILDRNDAVSTSWAVAAGYLCRLCGQDKILALVDLAKKFWFEHEEERARALSGEIVHDISRHAADRFNSLSSAILPFTFMAKHDISSTVVASTFKNVWVENTGGSGAIKLHLREIVTIAEENLGSNRWAVKQAAAITLADVCTSLGKDITKDQADVVYPAMVSAVGGKSWDGKERVLEGYVELVGNLRKIPDGKRDAEAKKIVIREAKRNNKVYQAQALKNLGKFVGYMETEDFFDEVQEIVGSALEEEDGEEQEDKMDIDEKGGKIVRSTKNTLYFHSLEALGQAFRPKFYKSEDNLGKVIGYITKPPSGLHLNYEGKVVQAEVMETLASRLTNPPKNVTVLTMWDYLVRLASDRGSEELRAKAVRGGVVNLARLAKAMGDDGKDVRIKVKGDLEKMAGDERSPSLRAVLEEVVKGL
ncbi:ARM repeat-containing protein [Terfezia boudieri ATCC MYA-4762]|uniref:ARM repeat-containing protein n=1 Tax=Terfezia boudieri ATCC MYA-4762 TaxID=1051890 RepID=A0A3N4LGM3_9PEZI|nr:ARM repeat-containing protein [Terfezia boudieri ATCC MYA-4762]